MKDKLHLGDMVFILVKECEWTLYYAQIMKKGLFVNQVEAEKFCSRLNEGIV